MALFALVGILVNEGYTQRWDAELFTVLNSWTPSPIADYAIVALSLYGRELVWGGFILGLFAFGGEREKKAALTIAVVFLILIVTGYAVKMLDYRQRPYDVIAGVRLLVPTEADSSFPSGHTLLVAGGAVIVWLRLGRRLAMIMAAEAAAVAMSRIYVGVHYPTDVLGGALLGAGVAFLIASRPSYIEKIYAALPEALKSDRVLRVLSA